MLHNGLYAQRINKDLDAELARTDKTIGKPLDAKIILHVGPEAAQTIARVAKQPLESFFIVSEAEISQGEGPGWAGTEMPGVSVEVEPSRLPKCPRCWTHSASVGSDSEYPELCARCAGALKYTPGA